MSQPKVSNSAVTLFIRFEVEDVREFLEVHQEAISEQRKYGVTEDLYQSIDDRSMMTIVLRGSESSVREWMEGSQRARLAGRLRLKSEAESWYATEM